MRDQLLAQNIRSRPKHRLQTARRERLRGARSHHQSYSKLYQKLSSLHHLFAVEPDVEVAADAVDMCLGDPVCAGVLGIGMAKSDVNTGDFFILQNMSNNVRASGVSADGKFAYAVAVFVGASVGAKFLAQVLVFRLQ